MLKVKIKYVAPVKLASAALGKKYATVAATTLVDVDSWIKEVGALTMEYKVDGHKFVASVHVLTRAKLDSDTPIKFYDADSKCVAKWVV